MSECGVAVVCADSAICAGAGFDGYGEAGRVKIIGGKREKYAL